MSLEYCASGVGAASAAHLFALNEGEALEMRVGAGGEDGEPAQAGNAGGPEPAQGVLSLPASSLVNGYLVLSYVRAKPNPGAGYIIESSADLAVWESTEGLIEERVSDLDATVERVDAVYLVPTDQAPQRFLRLRVVPVQ